MINKENHKEHLNNETISGIHEKNEIMVSRVFYFFKTSKPTVLDKIFGTEWRNPLKFTCVLTGIAKV